ncbi:RDD family protein [Dyella choica]|uniref:RDD family protein n=1 Tax=Dyella choica TaxID=1927959 RepID=UPI0013158A67|nr:RDD family protein [Dyella choica]
MAIRQRFIPGSRQQKITMETNNPWSVTLTGKTVDGREPATTWQQVAKLMRMEASVFQERIQGRLPVTLKAVAKTEAFAQRDALIEAGADAVALADQGLRQLWLQTDQGVCGPISEAYARHALDRGLLDRQMRASVKGENVWQTLEAALGLKSVPHVAPKPEVGKPLDTPASVPPPRQPEVSRRPETPAPSRHPPRELPMDGPADLYGGFWLRFVAWMIDGLIIRTALFVPEHVFGSTSLTQALIELAVHLVYSPLWESSAKQATPGKMVMGLQVTDAYGNRIDMGQAFGRHLGAILSYLPLMIGFVMAGVTTRKQALHDLIAGTFVVRKQSLQAWQALQEQFNGDTRAYRRGMPGWGIAVLVAMGGLVAITVARVAIKIGRGGFEVLQQQSLRDQVNEGVELADGAKQAVAAQLKFTHVPPTDNAAVGIGAPLTLTGKYVSSIAIDNGVVVVTYGKQASPLLRNKQLMLIPSREDDDVTWTCDSHDIDESNFPPSCLAE